VRGDGHLGEPWRSWKAPIVFGFRLDWWEAGDGLAGWFCCGSGDLHRRSPLLALKVLTEVVVGFVLLWEGSLRAF